MIRKIYILWLQGFNKAPSLIKKCVESWQVHNPKWKVIKIDETNLKDYINLEHYIPCIDKKTISNASLSDIIRIKLLKEYGGLWVDSTTFCNRPLDDWLQDYVEDGFFAIDKPAPDRMVSSWFLYSDLDNYIIDKWHTATEQYWKPESRKWAHHYFWFHYLFNDLYNEHEEFKEKWDCVKKIKKSTEVKFRHFDGTMIVKQLNEWVKGDIDNKKSSFYKLSHKFDESMVTKQSILSYFLSINFDGDVSGGK